MSKLLIEESPLQFQPSLAVAIGINEAIVLQQIHYWISNPKNKGYEQDGYKWVYNTYAEWKETNFPFWSESTIQRIFTNLEDMGLVVSIQPMKGKYDRTKYYRIDHSNLDTIEDVNLTRSLNDSETTTETTTHGSYEPITIEQAIWAGKPVTEEMINPEKLFEAKVKDAANLLDMGCKGGGALAEEFMLSRHLIIPESKIKGNRKAAREMLEMGVKPEHVEQAVTDLTRKGMTITDLFSISKTAIDLANKSSNAPVDKSFGL